MLTLIFRVVLRFALRDDFLLHLFLVLNELDIGDLLSRWRRNQEEERKDEDGDHHRDVNYVRAACRLGHLQRFVCINLFAMVHRRRVVCITHRESDEGEKQADYDERGGASQM